MHNAAKLLLIIFAVVFASSVYSQADDKVKAAIGNMPDEMSAGSTIIVTVTYTNTGNNTWSNQDFDVKETGKFDVTKINDLTWTIAPGESTSVDYRVTAPDNPGKHRIKFIVYYGKIKIAVKSKVINVISPDEKK